MALTDVAIRKAKPAEKPIRMFDVAACIWRYRRQVASSGGS